VDWVDIISNIILDYLPGAVLVLILYLLNRRLRYKDKLVNIAGTVIYKIVLFTLIIIIMFIFRIKYHISMLQDPIGLAIFFSYLYLISMGK